MGSVPRSWGNIIGYYWVSSKLTTSRIQTLKTQIHLTDILKELRLKMLYIMEHITYHGVYINNNYLYIYIILALILYFFIVPVYTLYLEINFFQRLPVESFPLHSFALLI